MDRARALRVVVAIAAGLLLMSVARGGVAWAEVPVETVESWVDGVRLGTEEGRRLAIREFHRLTADDVGAIPVLLRTLEEIRPAEQIVPLVVLCELLGPEDVDAIPLLIEMLHAWDTEKRRLATDGLATIGRPAVPLLCEQLLSRQLRTIEPNLRAMGIDVRRESRRARARSNRLINIRENAVTGVISSQLTEPEQVPSAATSEDDSTVTSVTESPHELFACE